MGGTPSETTYTIPYEKQFNMESSRTCGAACLSMVYKSLGKEVPQEEIWAAIAKVNRFGSLASATHLMVSDALNRGFDAVAIKARHPIFSLRCLRETNARVILSHRLGPDVPTGHYSVLVDVGQRNVTLHDPYFGPSRRLSHGDLTQLWEPGANTEIMGETLIAISAREEAEARCEICQTPIPAAVVCPQCGKPVGLRPAAGIGCISQSCVVRRWLNVCCPNCDNMWNFAAGPATGAPATLEKEEKAEIPSELEEAFGAIGKYYATIMAMPVAAKIPEVPKELEILKGLKAKVGEAAAQQLAAQKGGSEKLAVKMEQSKQLGEANKKQMEKLNAPPPPLDGNALAQSLLKNMGLIRRTGMTEIMKLPRELG